MRNSPSSSEGHRLSQALAALNQIGQTLLVIQDLPETLRKIAESTRDVLNADIVDLYEYIQERDEFILPPILCGVRRDPFVPKEKIYADDVVVKIVKAGRPQYYPDACQTDALTEGFVARADAPKNRFVVREGVESSVSLPLMAGAETVGVMFVNYRVKQTFDAEQRILIEAFSNLAALAIFNARLYQSEHERRLRYETLQETARVVNESLSPKEVSEHALEQLHKVVEFSSASVQLFEGDHRIVFSVRAFQLISDASRLHRDLSEDALVSRIIHNRQPLVLGNVLTEPLWEALPETSHIKSWIGAPLIAKGEVIGLLTVDHQSEDYYNSQHGEVVAAFASQLAVAMHNSIQAQALAQLNQLSQRLVSLSEESGKFHQLLEEIAKSAKEVLRADIIELYEYSQARKEYELPQISVGERRGPFVPKEKIYADDVVMKLIHLPGPSYVEKAQGDTIITPEYKIERLDKPAERFAVREEIQSTAVIPLKAGDEPVGLMFANYRTSQQFPHEQQELIELFANQAAIAIQNARLYKRIEDVNRRLEALVSFGQKLTSGIRLKEEEILTLIHRQASELMDTQNMYIALYDVATDTIRFGLAFQNGIPITINSRKIDDTQRGRTEEIIRTKKPIFIPTRDESEEWYKRPGRQKFVSPALPSWIGVPMISENKVLGVIATYHPTKDYVYQTDDLRILQGIAEQAAVAIENARSYNELDQQLLKIRQQITQAEEIIVMDGFMMDILHRVPNLVGTIPLRAENIVTELKKKPDEIAFEQVIEQVEGIQNDARTLLVSVRNWNPRQESLKRIPEDVQMLLNAALRNTLIPEKVEFETQFAEDLPCVFCNPKELFESFRCVIENGFQAMPNGGKLIIRADKFSSVDHEQPWILIAIQDTGIGIQPENLSRVFELGFTTKETDSGSGGLGYGLWRARALIQKVGGEISVESVVNQGTTFLIKLPGMKGKVCDD